MNGPSPDRKALEELWRQRVADAKLRVDFARSYVREVVSDFPPREISNADGLFAYQRAVQAENSALRDYARVSRIYQDLTVKGVIPDEAEWLKSRGAAAGGRDGSE
jgi:hypothetical protein